MAQPELKQPINPAPHPGTVDRALAEQRRFLGQELHDNIGQQLTGLGFLAHSVRRSLADADADVQPAVDHLVEGLKQALADVRSLSHSLVDDDRAASGRLAATLEKLAERTCVESSTNCRFLRQGDVDIDDPLMVRNLTRIAQEAIQNALRHARPDSVEVALRRDGDEVRMEIRDDGHGLPPKRVSIGIGLKNMWKRAREIGAELDVRSKEDAGTVVACTLNEGVA